MVSVSVSFCTVSAADVSDVFAFVSVLPVSEQEARMGKVMRSASAAAINLLVRASIVYTVLYFIQIYGYPWILYDIL